jgi:hypothetical protein
MRSSAPKMEKVLPLPVWPYAKMVAEYLVGALGCLRWRGGGVPFYCGVDEVFAAKLFKEAPLVHLLAEHRVEGERLGPRLGLYSIRCDLHT